MRAACLLAIDSSTEILCLAASGPAGDAVWAGDGGAKASALLLSQARTLLQEVGLSLAQLDAVAFGQGPGAFTGLRTACSAAQGLAFGLGCAVAPLDSLQIIAEGGRPESPACRSGSADVAVVMDARMGEVYAGRYAWQDQRWQTIWLPGLWRPDDLRAAWQSSPPRLWLGSGRHLVEAGLAQEQRSEASDSARARALLRLAGQAVHEGRTVHPRDASPAYVRDKVALTVAERWASANPA